MGDIKQLYLSMRTLLSRAVAGIVPPHEIEDVVQETYVKLCLVKNEDVIEHPRAYLFQMVKNLARDHVKRAGYRLSDTWDEEDLMAYSQIEKDRDEVLEQVVSNEKFSNFCDAVRMLPLQCKRAFVLKKVYGYSQREIARELDLAESTVEKHIALAMRRCAVFLEQKAGEDGVATLDSVGGTHE